jgi:glycosyltransferase involved in cell wall biosynthesis
VADTDGTAELPLVSIVTPSLNQGQFIEETIRSVLDQDYPRIEHIVVDGGSTDGTVETLRRHPHLVWVSEPDRGQADAVNKGFRMANGAIFGWLNADDLYLPGAVTTAVSTLRKTGCGLVHGGWCQIDQHGAAIRERIPPVRFDLKAQLNERNAVCQPGAFFTRAAFESVGGLDPSYRYAMDYELWLKLGARVGVTHVDAVLGAYRLHPASKTVAERPGFWAETVRASRAHGGRRFSPIYVDWYLPRARPSLYRLVRVYRFLRAGDIRGLGRRVAVHARTALSPRTRYALRVEIQTMRRRGLVYAARWNAGLADAWARDRLVRHRRYRVIGAAEVRKARRSERVFVFGSGASLNDLTDGEWSTIAEDDVFGFNAFYRQRWVRTDFHLLRGGVYGELRWRPHGSEVQRLIAANPRYADTIFLLQDEYLGQFANVLVGRGLLPRGARIFRYRTLPGPGLPSRSLADGVRHSPGTLVDCVNLAALLGWREIVLVGVDLYDSRYFWLPTDRTLGYDPAVGNVVPMDLNSIRGNRPEDRHNTATSGVVEQMAAWRDALDVEGVRLSVYNPRSLLAEVMPVFEPEAVR